MLKSYLHDKENEFQTIHNIHLDMIKQEQVEKEALIKYIKNLNTKPRKPNEEPIGSKITTRKKIVQSFKIQETQPVPSFLKALTILPMETHKLQINKFFSKEFQSPVIEAP